MPELPEVETVRRGLSPYTLGRRITGVTVREARLRWPVPADLAQRASGRRIDTLERRGKYLLFGLDNGDRLILHLGMTGRMLVVAEPRALQKHDHLDLQLDDGPLLRYHDPRRFGALLHWSATEPMHPLLAGMGPEPLSDAFDGAYLYTLSRGRSVAVKNFIMDGGVVVGAGNIYATEALFRAGIRPARPAGRVSRNEYERLALAIRAVLQEAIERGGTTLRDFAGADGHAGYFQQELAVYGRSDLPCPRCTTPVSRIVLGQRSSFYCRRCQR
jgi:formamidopyrimidine-DNA glycosylase